MSSDGDTTQVVLFKAPNDLEKGQRDVHHEILSKNGFQVVDVPVLDFDFNNLGDLLTKLKRPEDYSGIIFSSPRSVKACKLASETEECPEAILAKWKSHRNYAVGEATALAAEKIGVDAYGQGSGNANALADFICQDQCHKPFLYPTGSLTSNSFKLKLNESGIDVDDIVVYKTKPHPKIRDNLIILYYEVFYPAYFLFFSPSGVNYTVPLLKEFKYELDKVKFVAIGPTTEKSLRENEVPVYKTVPKPTPSAVLEALTCGMLD